MLGHITVNGKEWFITMSTHIISLMSSKECCCHITIRGHNKKIEKIVQPFLLFSYFVLFTFIYMIAVYIVGTYCRKLTQFSNLL